MAELLPQCQNLQIDSSKILEQESSNRSCNVTLRQTSHPKAISSKSEIVISAGKLMLINAPLKSELLYCAQGYATSTECKIEYVHPDEERVVLTSLSEAEVREQVFSLSEGLGLDKVENINQEDASYLLCQGCEAIEIIQALKILQKYTQAPAHLEKTLDRVAQEKIAQNKGLLDNLSQKNATLNTSGCAINSCLQVMQL